LKSYLAEIIFSNCAFHLNKEIFERKIKDTKKLLAANVISEIDLERLNRNLKILQKRLDYFKRLKRKIKKYLYRNILYEHRKLLFTSHFKKSLNIRKKTLNKAYVLPFGEVKDNYMQLKVNMDRMKDYDLANDFYYGEMEMKRLGEKWYKPKRWFLALYKFLSGYGNAPVRAALMFFALIWIFSFPLFFLKLGIKDLSSPNKNQVSKNYVKLEIGFFGNLQEMASLSLYNMTALSNLTRSPYEPLSKWTFYYVSVVQYFIRPVQIALIILAIRRKVKRGEE
jgi:hypothetical protein